MVELKTQQDAVINAVKTFDIEMLDDVLEESGKYQSFEKQKFLSKLQNVFEEFKSFGDTHLEIMEGRCDRCNKCNIGFSFIGNKSGAYMDLIFQNENDKITDIFECANFNTLRKGFKTKQLFIDNCPF